MELRLDKQPAKHCNWAKHSLFLRWVPHNRVLWYSPHPDASTMQLTIERELSGFLFYCLFFTIDWFIDFRLAFCYSDMSSIPPQLYKCHHFMACIVKPILVHNNILYLKQTSPHVVSARWSRSNITSEGHLTVHQPQNIKFCIILNVKSLDKCASFSQTVFVPCI